MVVVRQGHRRLVGGGDYGKAATQAHGGYGDTTAPKGKEREHGLGGGEGNTMRGSGRSEDDRSDGETMAGVEEEGRR